MLSLNLLTPERKDMYYWRMLAKSVIFWSIRILSILFIFSALFFIINLYLDYQISKMDREISTFENTEKVKKIKTAEEASKKINEILVNINKISEEQIYWSDALKEFIGIIPADVQIFSMDIGPGGKFTIAGMAKTRKDLLVFNEKLKNAPDFKNIQLPLESLTEKDDVKFQFNGEFLLDKFKASEKIKLQDIEEK